jgi:streptogramin lyase
VHRRALAPVATADTVLKSTRGITGERVVALGTPVGALTADTNGNVWASEPARGAVARVATGTVRAETFRVGGHPGALAAGNDRIWVADSALGPLAGLNPSTGKALPATSLAAAPTAVAVNPDDQSACAIDSSGTVTHVASTGAVLAADHAAETPTGVACGEGWVWAVQPSPAALIRMGADGGIRQFDGGPSPVAATGR